jgi:plastocyanin
MRRSRQALVAALGLTVAAATTVPVLAQTSSSSREASTRPISRLQANNFYFCKKSAPSCDGSDTNFRTHVVVGTKVKWFYEDTTGCDAIAICPGHSVKVKGHKASAVVKTDGALIKAMVFKSTGTFNYWCTVHRDQGMTGRIVVTKH